MRCVATMRKLKSKPALRPGELLFVTLITGFSVVALWQAFEISRFSGLSTPGVFPMLAAGTMLVSALFILSDSLSRRYIESNQNQSKVHVLTWRLIVVITLVAAYVLAMPYLGFMLSSAVFLLVSFLFLWRKSVGVSVLLTTGTLLAIYLIFRILFQVVLPRGSLVQAWL